MTESEDKAGHSAEYFGETRDYWYEPDFVALMARRWRLGECHAALDVGSGIGHWGRLLAPHLAADARLVGVERDPQWVTEATKRAAAAGLGARCSYQVGDALALPVQDGAFDLVTCQTVLIHLADVRAALREMVRALAPGGLLAVAEPNNVSVSLVQGSATFDDPIETIMDLARFQLTCERGKAALGEGNNSIGDLLPGYFAEVGLADVTVFLSDKAELLLPPYASREQRARTAETLDWAGRGFWIWDEADTARFFLAGGGTQAELARLWALAMDRTARVADAIRKRTWHEAGARTTYLIAGRKPR